jgi:hypothetical protein
MQRKDRPRQPWRTATITAEGRAVASVRVTVDQDAVTVRVRTVDERIRGVRFPTETVHNSIASRHLFAAAEELLLDAACKQLRLAAAQTIEEVAHD